MSAQGPGSRTAPEPLGRLKQALETAGATALTATEETNINSLITAYRDAHKPPTPFGTVTQARTDYDTAILNGDTSTAWAKASLLANEASANNLTRLKDEASFAISVVQELRKNGDQAAKLQTRFGTDGVARMLIGLVAGPGGPGGPGGRGMQAGRPMSRPPN